MRGITPGGGDHLEPDILAVDDVRVDRLTLDRIGTRLGLVLVVGRVEADVVFAELIHNRVKKGRVAVVAGVKFVCGDDIGEELQDHIPSYQLKVLRIQKQV